MVASRSLLMALVVGCTLGAANPSSAQSYPKRTVKIVVSGIPGTSFDLIARAIADKLSASLKQTFIVENRPGAAGNLGAEAVAKSAPDGHTLLVALGTTFTVNPSLYKKPPFDPNADFTYISTLTKSTNMLVVHPSIPVNSVAEFVAYAKKEPISYAHGGPGTPGHLCMEYFRLLAGFQATPVPYRGNTQLAADLAAGQIKFGFVGTSGVAQHVREGRLKGLAISTSRALSACAGAADDRRSWLSRFRIRGLQRARGASRPSACGHCALGARGATGIGVAGVSGKIPRAGHADRLGRERRHESAHQSRCAALG